MANVRISKMLYITGFHPSTTREDLIEHLSPFGRILYIQKATRHAFVNFETREQASEAIEELDGEPLFGSVLTVIFAHMRQVDPENCLRVRNLRQEIAPLHVLGILDEAGDLIQIQKVSDNEAIAEFFHNDDAMYALNTLNGRLLMGTRILLLSETDLEIQDPQVSSSTGVGSSDHTMPTPIPHMDYQMDDEDEEMEPDSTTYY